MRYHSDNNLLLWKSSSTMLPALQRLQHYAALKRQRYVPQFEGFRRFFSCAFTAFCQPKVLHPPRFFSLIFIAMRYLVKALHVRQLCLNCELRVDGCQTTSWSKKKGYFLYVVGKGLTFVSFFLLMHKMPIFEVFKWPYLHGFHHFNWTVNAYMYSIKYVMFQKRNSQVWCNHDLYLMFEHLKHNSITYCWLWRNICVSYKTCVTFAV